MVLEEPLPKAKSERGISLSAQRERNCPKDREQLRKAKSFIYRKGALDVMA
jgi:hypothetical protein